MLSHHSQITKNQPNYIIGRLNIFLNFLKFCPFFYFSIIKNNHSQFQIEINFFPNKELRQ